MRIVVRHERRADNNLAIVLVLITKTLVMFLLVLVLILLLLFLLLFLVTFLVVQHLLIILGGVAFLLFFLSCNVLVLCQLVLQLSHPVFKLSFAQFKSLKLHLLVLSLRKTKKARPVLLAPELSSGGRQIVPEAVVVVDHG